mmetsp:Transcript_54984/g.116865  ORF Transcript_54984/g.116865 Transcript_54984/m.116865 type:complete len:176 (-) Transcript_54984:176-703(-)|eukprot:CAMPEP_0172532460 /NCGR_PEP_ID=MMETSP1067-20121228/5513_1 /TAXON_ID=265564 ORGANISM="Thalassiosira punctigera, Strain Tpunct2005C2" /NCGR_SAMPLE_ID=MMETSP1067 /ASSEMBLY_ACC=CAM_ASM_000444 /LENGTH=175 /DNA_ID=CAMNT_0013316987 /DNA_START=113 /DNA_END=640 /DNA_ORIENTATION=-
MKAAILVLYLPSVISFVLTTPVLRVEKPRQVSDNYGVVIAEDPSTSGVQQSRRAFFETGSIIAAFVLGSGSQPANAIEQKIYSSNARNMARLNSGDSSGGSIYDNNPTLPKARARRAMVGCKNSSARSLAGEIVGNKKMSEKECNMIVMSGEADFMLGALVELDCPTCPYGIGSR